MDLTDNVIEEVQKKEGLIASFLDTLPEKADPSKTFGAAWHPDRTGTGILFHWNAADQADPQDHP